MKVLIKHRHLTVTLIFLCTLAHSKLFDVSGSSALTAPSDRNASPQLVLNQQQNEIFKEATDLLTSMESAPSCNRIAAVRLVKRCKALGEEATDPEANERLDTIRSVYAARLAICELEGAGATVPSSCLPLTMSQTPPKRILGFGAKTIVPDTGTDIFPREVLEPCLKALESRAQWWISYSNNKQNAMVICQASRVEMEKDELLNLHRSIVDSNFKLNEGLRMALRNAAMESQQNEAFLKAVHQLQQQLTASIEKSQSTFQDTFSKILHDVQVGVRSAFSGITSSLSVMGKDMAALEKNVHNITSQVHSLKSSLGEIHKDAIGLSKELFQVQQENSLAHQDLTLGLRRSLESLLSRDLVMIFQAMHEFNNSLEWLGSRLNEVSEREAEVAERLKAVNQDMKKSEEKAQDLHKAQKLQADALIAHAKTQGELQATAKISQELVEQTSMAAAHLHSILEDAALKAQRLPDFRIGGFNTWTLCFIIVITITASRSPIVATGILFTFVGHWIARAILPYLGAIIPHH